MSEHFQPGDMVECVEAAPHQTGSYYLCPLPQLREVYVVSRCWADPHGRPRVVIDCVPNPDRSGRDWGWGTYRFRKVYRPDPKLIERLTAEPVFAPPIRKPVKEDA